MADVVNTAPQLKSEIQDRINQTSPNAQGIGDLGTIIITPISEDQVLGGNAIFDPLYNNFQKDESLPTAIGPVIGDSRNILFGDIDPGANNVEIRTPPNLVTPSEATVLAQQDPFTNPNPPVIASNAGKIHNITNIAQRQQANQSGVTIGDSSNIRNIDFLTGQPTNNNAINSVAGVDDSTQGNNSFLRFGERIDGQFDPSAQPIRGNTGDFLRSQTASGNGLFDDSTAVGTGGDDPFDKFRNGERLQGFNAGDGDVTGTARGTGAFVRKGTGQRTTSDTTAPELSADWRFRIGLLPGSQDLYKSGNAGILEPLIATNGVIFPYTPSIQMTYYADYQSTAPTHSNFPSRFYASSEVRDVQVNATFTAQSTAEADYMMAAIHFFRSATKMFYGQDSNRGQTPPLLQVTGLGPHQFNGHKCVLQQFNYTLPEDVDYVRTSAGGVTTKSVNQVRARRESGADQFGIFGIAGRIGRLLGIGANKGAMPNTLTQRSASSSLAKAGASYVPTKMEFSLTLLPVVSRQEQTANYSTLGYANGENYKNRGHW